MKTFRRRVAVWLMLALITLSFAPTAMATHGWTGYPATAFTTRMWSNDDYTLRMWKYTYYGHNTSTSVQLRETSHWNRLESSEAGPVDFTLFNFVENPSGIIVPISDYYYYRTIGVSQQINVIYPYNGGAGITVSKGSGAVFVQTEARQTTQRFMMQRLVFAPDYTCHANHWGYYNTLVSSNGGNC